MVRSCRVTVTDYDGIDHSIDVMASTLYEAVALALAAVRGADWVGPVGEGLNAVRVVVKAPVVEHTVKMAAFRAWLARDGGAPNEKMARLRAREVLADGGGAK